MTRSLLAVLLAAALAPGLGCLAYNDPCQPLVPDPDAVIGFLGEDVFLERAFARHDNNALGQLAADAYQHAEDDTGAPPAQLGVINGGAIRAEGLCLTRTRLPTGPLTDGVLHEVILFENRVVTVDLTELELVNMFEHSVGGLSRVEQPIITPFGGFLHVSESTTLRVDCSRPSGQRVRELTVGGVAVQLPPRTGDSLRYRVAMPNFLLDGGDGYGPIFGNAGTNPARNPVRSSKLGGVDANIAAAYMKSRYPNEARPLKEAARVVFENCAKPARPAR
jgi:5'-nucleotidase/UDP-sugar diphosphatase